MKYLKIVLLCLLLVVFVAGLVNLNSNKNISIQGADYLRLHIRANSNSEEDQNIKYEIKNELLNIIVKDISGLSKKEEIESYFATNKTRLEKFVNNILKTNGFNYISNIKLNNEYFPTRSYNGVTLTSGFYDAIIVELGLAEGNNWWCVAYPPLCFMYETQEFGNITYKSKIVEIIEKFFKRWLWN